MWKTRFGGKGLPLPAHTAPAKSGFSRGPRMLPEPGLPPLGAWIWSLMKQRGRPCQLQVEDELLWCEHRSHYHGLGNHSLHAHAPKGWAP